MYQTKLGFNFKKKETRRLQNKLRLAIKRQETREKEEKVKTAENLFNTNKDYSISPLNFDSSNRLGNRKYLLQPNNLDELNVSSFDVQNSSRDHHAQEEAVEKQVDHGQQNIG